MHRSSLEYGTLHPLIFLAPNLQHVRVRDSDSATPLRHATACVRHTDQAHLDAGCLSLLGERRGHCPTCCTMGGGKPGGKCPSGNTEGKCRIPVFVDSIASQPNDIILHHLSACCIGVAGGKGCRGFRCTLPENQAIPQLHYAS